jgi:sulfate permease, SulP family
MSVAGVDLDPPSLSNSPTLREAFTSPTLMLRETLAGIVTALALVPEVISFSFVSRVDPTFCLVASVVLGLTMSLLGGRPAMVTAAAGSVALVLGPMVRAHGLGYILPCVCLAGVIQIVFGLVGLARLMRFVPRSVMIGFVNALGILIFYAQTPHLFHAPLAVVPLFLVTTAIVLALPRMTTAVPAPLVAIILVTLIAVFGHMNVPRVGAGVTGSVLQMTRLSVPLDLGTLKIIWPTAVSVAFVGLLETLLTAKLVDEMTDTPSNKGKESWALGLANILAAFFGGTAGCAMIGQTVVNVKLGAARTRVSTAVAALALLALVTALERVMALIPMIALASVMMIVAVKTFDWRSVSPTHLRRMPLSETALMAATVAVTIATGNLAAGVGCGVLLAVLLFASRAAHVLTIERILNADDGSVLYLVHGPLFFGSSNDLVERFRYADDPASVTIDFSSSHIWDASSVAALDAVEAKYEARGAAVRLIGLDSRSSTVHARLTGAMT